MTGRAFALPVLTAALVAGSGLAPAATPDAATRCLSDLDFIPGFLLANDPGAPVHMKQHGEAVMARALDDAHTAIAQVQGDADCLSALNRYLKAWRTGHLAVSPAVGMDDSGRPAAEGKATDTPGAPRTLDPAAAPTIAFLSPKTALITVPTFHPYAQRPLETLLSANARKLTATRNWIIDLRRNDGGADSTYAALLAAIMVSPRREVGAQFLSTPANITNTGRVCEIYSPGDENCVAQISALSHAMEAVPRGSYARPPKSTQDIEDVSEHRAPAEAPQRVAILIDHPCGSSCEQFLLSARQSYNVKLFGRSTSGSLDYSNLRPQDLPSGKRMLWYATSRSARLPHLPVDAAGIPPDVFLPPPADDGGYAAEVPLVRAMLEQ